MTVVSGRYIPVYVPEVAAILSAGTYNSVRLYVASSQTAAGSLLTTITLVAGQTQYSYDYTSGVSTQWTYWTYYHTGTAAESDPSERVPLAGAPAVTFASLAQRAADRCNLYMRPYGDHTFPGPSGTTTTNGNVGGTTLICTSYADSEYPSREFTHWTIRATSGARSGEERRLITEPLTTASGTFTTARAFGGQILSGVTFEGYGGITGTQWRQAVNEALLDLWTPVEWSFAGTLNQTEYPIPYFFEGNTQILNLVRTGGDTLRDHTLTGGVDFLFKPTEGGSGYLYVPGGLGENLNYRLEGWRHPAMFSADADTMLISEQNQRILVVGAAVVAMTRLSQRLGNETDTSLVKELRDELEHIRQALGRETDGFKRLRNPRQSQIVSTGGGGGWRGMQWRGR